MTAGPTHGVPQVGPVLEAVALHKRYGGRRRGGGGHVAVEDVSLALHPGEVVALLGPNGAGKTTTMKMLTGLTRPTSGSATLDGLPAHIPAARRRLGYLPEQFRFPDWMTGREVLELHARLAGIDATAALDGPDGSATTGALARVGLEGRGDDRVGTYSKGMQQRLGLAQALLGAPVAVLLDEPTSALDPIGRRLVREVVRDLAAGGVAVLLNSHLLSEVEMVADRAVIMDRGAVVYVGRLDDLGLATVEVRVELDRVDARVRGVAAAHGTVGEHDDRRLVVTLPDLAAVEGLAAALVRHGCGLRALVPVRRSLEEVFVDLVRGSADGSAGPGGRVET